MLVRVVEFEEFVDEVTVLSARTREYETLERSLEEVVLADELAELSQLVVLELRSEGGFVIIGGFDIVGELGFIVGEDVEGVLEKNGQDQILDKLSRIPHWVSLRDSKKAFL